MFVDGAVVFVSNNFICIHIICLYSIGSVYMHLSYSFAADTECLSLLLRPLLVNSVVVSFLYCEKCICKTETNYDSVFIDNIY